jgi:hypothetical protein
MALPVLTPGRRSGQAGRGKQLIARGIARDQPTKPAQVDGAANALVAVPGFLLIVGEIRRLPLRPAQGAAAASN